MFGGDSITRLAHQDRIRIVYQLPALQASLFLLGKVSTDPALARCWMALLGAAAGVAFYYLARDLLGPQGGLCAAWLFVSHPFVLAHSTVPYQEIVLLGALAAAFHFCFKDQWIAASAALGLACLTRYEAWLACPVLVLALLRKKGWRWSEAGRAVALFGWAPAVWIVWHGGLSPAGTYVAERYLTPARAMRYAYLAWITARFTPLPVLALAGAGLHRAWKLRLPGSERCRVLWAFLALFLGAIVFSAHGVPPDPERFVTAREAQVPMAAAVLLAALALERWPRWRAAVTALSVAIGLGMAVQFVAQQTAEPRLQLSYRLAAYLDDTVPPGETVLVLVEPISPAGVDLYLGRIRRREGEAGVEEARRVLEQYDGAPDYERIVVHARRVRAQLRVLPSAVLAPTARAGIAVSGIRPDWLVVWSDFEVRDEIESRLLSEAKSQGETVRTIRSGPVSATVYRLSRPPS